MSRAKTFVFTVVIEATRQPGQKQYGIDPGMIAEEIANEIEARPLWVDTEAGEPVSFDLKAAVAQS